MNQAILHKFGMAVKMDPIAQMRLGTARSEDTFLSTAVEIAHGMGLDLTRSDFSDAIARARSNQVKTSDKELKDVAGSAKYITTADVSGSETFWCYVTVFVW